MPLIPRGSRWHRDQAGLPQFHCLPASCVKSTGLCGMWGSSCCCQKWSLPDWRHYRNLPWQSGLHPKWHLKRYWWQRRPRGWRCIPVDTCLHARGIVWRFGYRQDCQRKHPAGWAKGTCIGWWKHQESCYGLRKRKWWLGIFNYSPTIILISAAISPSFFLSKAIPKQLKKHERLDEGGIQPFVTI